MTRVALCFPGQGSQSPGMAAGLETTELGGRLLGVAGDSGADLGPAFCGDEEMLRPTEVAQPALVFTEVVLAAALPAELEVVAVAGHSVGELAACAAARALSAETALRLAVERGRLMAGMREGTMAAVLGMEAEAVTALCAEVRGTVAVANLNGPGQVVVSGTGPAVAELSERALAAGARRVLPLRVSGAFHSALMEAAAVTYARLLDTVAIGTPAIPVIANVDAAAVIDAEELRARMRDQMTSAVRWTESVERMLELGAEVLVEVGPGSVLTGLARRIAPATPALSVGTLDAVAELARRLGSAHAGTP